MRFPKVLAEKMLGEVPEGSDAGASKRSANFYGINT